MKFEFFSKIPETKSNILRCNWEKFESSRFISAFNPINWEKNLYNEKNDVNFSMNEYLPNINSPLDSYAPLKILNKKEMEFFIKPWIT